MPLEKTTPVPLSYEVSIIRKWMEKEIADRGICPPLTKVFARSRDELGGADWNQIANEIDLETFRDFKPQNPFLVEKVSCSYTRYILRCIESDGPLSKVIILPDFGHNVDYDKFINEVKERTLEILLSTPENIEAARLGFQQIKKIRGVSEAEVELFLMPGMEVGLMTQIIEGAFNPVYFYGRKLGDRDISDMRSIRGPVERQKFLSRAPFYLLQVVNPISAPELIGTLDKPKLRTRNSKLALGEDLSKLESTMKKYRRGE